MHDYTYFQIALQFILINNYLVNIIANIISVFSVRQYTENIFQATFKLYNVRLVIHLD